MAERNVFKEEAAAAEALVATVVATAVAENLGELLNIRATIRTNYRNAFGDDAVAALEEIIAAHNAWKLASERMAQAMRAVNHAVEGTETGGLPDIRD